MARNEQRRQKKLALKKAKRNEERRVIARAESSGISGGMALASRWPVVQARVSATLWDQGMGYAVLVRRGPGGLAAMAMFLLDVYCLGVKDVIAHVAPDHAISASVARVNDNGGQWIDVSPEHVRKLVEGALGYALSLGLAPHRDCAAAMSIFGELESSQCATEFTFGFQGQPHFIAGPYDRQARVVEVLSTLRRTCGPDSFHYTVPIESSDMSDELEEVLDGTEYGILDQEESDSEVIHLPRSSL